MEGNGGGEMKSLSRLWTARKGQMRNRSKWRFCVQGRDIEGSVCAFSSLTDTSLVRCSGVNERRIEAGDNETERRRERAHRWTGWKRSGVLESSV